MGTSWCILSCGVRLWCMEIGINQINGLRLEFENAGVSPAGVGTGT